MTARFRYSQHAKDRMRDRHVTRLEVEECVSNPAVVYQTRKGNNYRQTVNEKPLRIVVAADKDNDREKFVVTVIDESEDDDAV